MVIRHPVGTVDQYVTGLTNVQMRQTLQENNTDIKGAVPLAVHSIDPEVETIGMDIIQIVDAETMKTYFLLSVQRQTTFSLPRSKRWIS